MRIRAGLLALLIAASAMVCAQAEEGVDYAPLVGNLVKGYAVPASNALAEALAPLPDAIAAACADPASIDKKGLAAATFTQSVAAYERIAVLRFGALADEHRLERLAFIPDARGVVRRQVDRLLANPEADALDPDTLRSKSVALQGLTALERVVFSADGEVTLDGGTEPGACSCKFAEAIALRLIATAKELRDAYAAGEGQTGLLLSPGGGNSLAHSDKEAVEQVFNALLTGLAVLRDQVIERVLEDGKPEALASRAPFFRSRNEFAYLSAGFSGLNDAVAAGGFIAAAPSAGQWIENSMALETRTVTATLDSLQPPLADVLADETQRKRLEAVELATSGIRDTLGRELAGYLDLKGGFNALDGD